MKVLNNYFFILKHLFEIDLRSVTYSSCDSWSQKSCQRELPERKCIFCIFANVDRNVLIYYITIDSKSEAYFMTYFNFALK